MHQAARSSDQNVAGVTASADGAVEGRKFIRKITSLIIVAAAVLITLYVWGIIERHPRTDDATARANVVGIAPRVAGQILKLNVQDNQAVKEGDVLFEIDPEDYRLVLEKAKADLAALDQQIAQAGSTLQRLEPLLPKRFTTAESVDEARTKLTTLQAQREGVGGDHQSRATPSLLLQGHRAFFRTCHQSQHFGRRPCYHRGSRLLVARHEQMVRDREFSRGAKSDIWLPAAKRLFIFRPRLTSDFAEKCRESDGQ